MTPDPVSRDLDLSKIHQRESELHLVLSAPRIRENHDKNYKIYKARVDHIIKPTEKRNYVSESTLNQLFSICISHALWLGLGSNQQPLDLATSPAVVDPMLYQLSHGYIPNKDGPRLVLFHCFNHYPPREGSP